MIDLKPFCSNSSFRPVLSQPFALGEYTFATNSHIAVRVARVVGSVDAVGAPDMDKLFKDTSGIPWRPLRKFKKPEPSSSPCESCDGRGHEHSCPDCTCVCGVCDGTGLEIDSMSMFVGDRLFDVEYVLLLAALPGIEVPDKFTPGHDGPMPFRFDGGDGLIMALRRKHKNHIEDIA